MTQEQKAKRYDEALKWMRRLYPTMTGIDKEDAEHYFPELRESEDEKIRQGLITSVSSILKGHVLYGTDISREEALTWLEKQGTSYTRKDVDDAYLKGVTDTKNEIEKQYEANYQIRKDIATFIFNYRGDIKDRAKWMNYLGIKVSFVEKQGEQKSIWHNEDEEPQRGSLILLVMQSGTPIVAKVVEPNHIFNHGERWAYIDDLLEKQDEQKPQGKTALEAVNEEKVDNQNCVKPTDKVEPKFHKGDWIISDTANKDYRICNIIDVKDGNYAIESIYGYKGYNQFDVFDNTYRLWDITKDAKDGDMIYVSTEEKGIQAIFYKYEGGIIYFHCSLCGDFIADGYMPIGAIEFVNPLQKVHYQRFFEKMHEASYEWNAEKKELKKIEQKPTDEEMIELLRTEYEKGRADAIAETQVDWSDEDERIRNCLIKDQEEALTDVKNDKYGHSEIISDLKEMYNERISWLKDLKQRITNKQ